MPSRTVTVVNDGGLHARPGRVFVKTVLDHKCPVSVRKGDHVADARSMLSLMAVQCGPGDEIEIIVEGDDAERALSNLVRLVEDGLGER
jgi:phosphotransferase system HPr (HPr) family protein